LLLLRRCQNLFINLSACLGARTCSSAAASDRKDLNQSMAGFAALKRSRPVMICTSVFDFHSSDLPLSFYFFQNPVRNRSSRFHKGSTLSPAFSLALLIQFV